MQTFEINDYKINIRNGLSQYLDVGIMVIRLWYI